MIPAQAVEAAARAAYARTNPYSNWRLAIRPLRDRYLDEARAALEAAAPHMLAGAWDEGWDTFAGFDSRPGGPYPANPYRPTE